jgi:hypothetical protein
MSGINCGDFSNVKSHQTHWRLPRMRELHSLININIFDTAISNATGDGKCVNQPPPNSSVEITRFQLQQFTVSIKELAEWFGLEIARIVVDECLAPRPN